MSRSGGTGVPHVPANVPPDSVHSKISHKAHPSLQATVEDADEEEEASVRPTVHSQEGIERTDPVNSLPTKDPKSEEEDGSGSEHLDVSDGTNGTFHLTNSISNMGINMRSEENSASVLPHRSRNSRFPTTQGFDDGFPAGENRKDKSSKRFSGNVPYIPRLSPLLLKESVKSQSGKALGPKQASGIKDLLV